MHFLPLWPPQVSVEKVRSSELTVWHQANAVLLLCNCKIKVIRESITPKFVSSTHIEATLWLMHSAIFPYIWTAHLKRWDSHKTQNHTLSTPSSWSSSPSLTWTRYPSHLVASFPPHRLPGPAPKHCLCHAPPSPEVAHSHYRVCSLRRPGFLCKTL